ncbi:MAG: glucosaminidase domain-containing protein [Patescibacteria group bacterium]
MAISLTPEQDNNFNWRLLAVRSTVGLALASTALGAAAQNAEAYIDNGDGTVTVEEGDTLWEIVGEETGAQGEDLIKSIEATANINEIVNKDEIFVGQTLRVAQPVEMRQTVRFPESPTDEPNAVWTVKHVKHTPWLVSHITAAIEGTTQKEALQKILAANPNMVPEKLQLGDSFRLPGTSQIELKRALKFISHYARLQDTESGSGNVPQKSNTAESPNTKSNEPQAQEQNSNKPKKEKPMNTDPKILANQVLEHPNIIIEDSPNNRVERSIEDATDDGKTFNYDVDRDNQNEIQLSPRLLQTLKFLADKGYEIEITSVTTGLDHVETSNHYKGLAVDIAINDQAGFVFTDLYINREILGLNELILGAPPAGTANLKHGQAYGYSEEVLRNHDNHIHFSVMGYDPMVDQKQGEFLEIEPDGEVHLANEEPTSSEPIETTPEVIELSAEENAIIDSMDLEQHKKDFLKQMVIEARKTAHNYRINPAVMVAQAILESTWGENADGFNYFGNKAGENWTGPTQEWHTFEYDENGNRYETTATFKVFASPEEAFNEYGRMIQDAEWYEDAEVNHANWQAYLHGLVNEPPMYATAPDYEQVIGGIINQFRLAELTHTQ